MAKKEVKSESTEAEVAPVKRGRGRPKGTTKKSKGQRRPDGTFKSKIELENAVPEGTKAVTKNTGSK